MALTIPMVTVCPTPKGLPMARTCVADLKLRGVANRDGGQAAASILMQRDVGLGVGADDPRFEFAAVGQGDLNVSGSIHDVVIGEDIAVRTNDDAGAKAAFAVRLGRRLETSAVTIAIAAIAATE